MWHCANCGQQIDDKFDACWKCGTAHDRTRAADFHVEADDPAVPDLGPDREPPSEREAESESARMLHERIVELCSVGNSAEADGLCTLLAEAGIHARVVGDVLGGAAGGLPLGEPIAPRVWVRESDLARAREAIDQWRGQQATEPVEFPESEMPPEGESPVEAEYAELPSDVRLRFLSQGFYIVGLVCIVVGAVWGWKDWMELSMFSATAVGRFNDGHLDDLKTSSLSAPSEGDVPSRAVKRTLSHAWDWDAEYVYAVQGRQYCAQIAVARGNETPEQVTIHYNPRDPAAHVIGSIAPPWMILLFASLVGAFFCFVGYQFR